METVDKLGRGCKAPFEDIEPGRVFRHEDTLYVKNAEGYGVSFKDGDEYHFEPRCWVRVFKHVVFSNYNPRET